ncbi:FKBP-type peptidyl-prolyl cis-trans isomerase [Ornithinicoccus halotolerans]|uniref:FKBP-type peptidyl-prolyl cis-trans isomerase n=1 Tax=Ornithinicoccus halotolerans TaxID=1748220 RepID=UPI001297916B|nr:FKBP-type peptidyl-prolyl cis-trans isomerase [Ornithinicoccus halotolerans]
MPAPRPRLLALALAPLVLLAACSSGGEGADDSALTSAPDDAAVTSIPPTGDFSEVAVERQEQDGGEVPVITYQGEPMTDEEGQPADTLPLSVAETQVRELAPGDGEPVQPDQHVELRYLAVNATNGSEVVSTFPTDEQVVMDLSNESLLPGFQEQLPGVHAGAELLLAMPPEDAFGEQGYSELGVGSGDTLLFYLEVVGSHSPLEQAEGEPVEPPEGLPTVEADGSSPAEVTIPEGEDPPEELVVEPLIQGEGPEVAEGDQVTVHYTGVKWSDGSVFDSSLEAGEPFGFQVGANMVIPGWDQGVVGQRVGSRLLLITPPDVAYGDAQEGHELKEETLVFVVDILDAH